MKDRQDNAADPARVKRGRRADRRREELYRAAVKQSLASAATRLVFAEWMARAGVFQPANAHESATLMFYNEGRRSFGLDIRQALEDADAELLDVLYQERRARDTRELVDDDAEAARERDELTE